MGKSFINNKITLQARANSSLNAVQRVVANTADFERSLEPRLITVHQYLALLFCFNTLIQLEGYVFLNNFVIV